MTTNVKENRTIVKKNRIKNKELAKLRVDKNMTQRDIAEIMNMTPANISSIERGEKAGTVEFWYNFKIKFDLTDTEVCKIMWSVFENDTEEKSQN